MSKAELLCLYDDGAQVGTPLIGHRGFSVLIDVDGQRTMFDAGSRGRYLDNNMAFLDIEADSVDRVVVSHGSLNHIGGLDAFMSRRTKKVEVYSRPASWEVKRRFSPLISEENALGIEHRFIENDWIQLSENLYVSPPVSYDHEESLMVLRTKEGAVVISACAHGGILNSMSTVGQRFGRIHALVGGMHLNKVKQPVVDEIVAQLTGTYGIQRFHLNGCTTAEGIQKMRVATSIDSVKDFFAGDRLTFQTY